MNIMQWSRLTPLALLITTTMVHAGFTYHNSDTKTEIKVGGLLNVGYHGEHGDYADWQNISTRKEAAENLRYTENYPGSSSSAIEAARKNYQSALDAYPYWESRDTSVNDIYLRLNFDINQKIDDRYSAFAFYERDFRSSSSDDDVRDVYAGIRHQDWGSVRFGRDESGLTHVRDLIYSLDEKSDVGDKYYQYQSFIEPLAVSGRHDNSLLYSYDAKDFAFELGYIFDTEEDFVNQSGYAASGKYVLFDRLTLALGYSGGEIKADKKGNIIRPNLTRHGLSSYAMDQVFANAIYNTEYKIDQKQFNIGVGYTGDSFRLGATWFKSDYDMDVRGSDRNYATNSTSLDYTIKGIQTSAQYSLTNDLELALMYTRADNDDNDFTILNALALGSTYNITQQFKLYVNAGANNSDASHSVFTNTGVQYYF